MRPPGIFVVGSAPSYTDHMRLAISSALLIVVLFVALWTTCSKDDPGHEVDHVVPPYQSAIFTDEMTEFMYSRSVRILVKCPNKPFGTKMGSGFMGPDSKIYTARHVMDCGKLLTGEQVPAFVVVLAYDGTEYVAITDETIFGKEDTASFAVVAEVTGAVKMFLSNKGTMKEVKKDVDNGIELPLHADISARDPKIGEVVCFVGGAENPAMLTQRKCGEVFKVMPEDGTFWMSAFVAGGNSGGPVYDLNGKVLGVAIQMNGPRSRGDLGILVQRASYLTESDPAPEPDAGVPDAGIADAGVPDAKMEEAAPPVPDLPETPDLGIPDLGLGVPMPDPPGLPGLKGDSDSAMPNGPDGEPLLRPRGLQDRTERLTEDLMECPHPS